MAAVGPGRTPRKPVDKLTKPELLALVKRLHKRIVRLEAQLAPAPQANEWTPPWRIALTNSFQESK